MAYFPLFVSLEGEPCFVAGGGKVAWRKCRVLAEFGAKVQVTAPDFCQEMLALAEGNPGVRLVRRPAIPQDAEGMSLVICATDDFETNREIADYCKQCRIPVNSADDRANSTFFFPGIVRQEDMVLGISTGGKSPAASKYLRCWLECRLPSFMGRLVKTLGELREEVKASVKGQERRDALFAEFLQEGLAREGDLPDEVIRERIKQMAETESKPLQNEKEREQAE